MASQQQQQQQKTNNRNRRHSSSQNNINNKNGEAGTASADSSNNMNGSSTSGGGRGGGRGNARKPQRSSSFTASHSNNSTSQGAGAGRGGGGGRGTPNNNNNTNGAAGGNPGRGGAGAGAGAGRNAQQRNSSFRRAAPQSRRSTGSILHQQQQQQTLKTANSSKNLQGNNSHNNNGGQRRAPSRANSSSSTTAGGNNNNNNKQQNASQQHRDSSRSKERTNKRESFEDAILFTSTGAGATPEEASVIRHSATSLLACRAEFLDPPILSDAWSPYSKCEWTESDRTDLIQQEMKVVFDYKPLEVNEQTRWKPKVMLSEQEKPAQEDDTEAQLRKATAILNKLSWTTLDKLTRLFLDSLGAANRAPSPTQPQTTNGTPEKQENVLSKQILQASMALVVDKAMMEPHFAEMYASFSAKLAAVHKAFKKTILALCQEKFEEIDKDSKFPDDMDAAEREAALSLNRKRSIGLMKFIGELYKMKLLKGAIMTHCLKSLLVPDDEEKLECFTKLMTTIGTRLHENENVNNPNTTTSTNSTEQDQQEQQREESQATSQQSEQQQAVSEKDELQQLWDTVFCMAGRTPGGPMAPSVRIRFLLQDLIELKENDWVQRRKEEKAKTIAELHKEVKAEEQQHHSFSRRSSSGSLTGLKGARATPPTSPMKRSQSVVLVRSGSTSSTGGGSAMTSTTDSDGFTQIPGKPKKAGLRRVKSDQQPITTMRQSMAQPPSVALETSPRRQKSSSDHPSVPPPTRNGSLLLSDVPIVENYLEPGECAKKATNMLKEYFIGGDMNDAVLTMDELIGYDNEGHVARGGAVLEAGILLVMERKEDDVRKFVDLVARCIQEENIGKEALRAGLVKDALEYLRDIEIDAPMAASFLATIVADWMSRGCLDLDVLQEAPEYFKTDGRPAEFAAQVLSRRGGAISDAEVSVVSNLMTDQERQANSDVRAWLEEKAKK